MDRMLMNLMGGRLPDAAMYAISVALGCVHILEPMLDLVKGVSPRSPILDAAVGVVLVTLPATYLMGTILLYIHVTPPAAAPPPGASRWFAALACTLASVLLVALAAFLFLVGSPPTTGPELIPT